MTLQRVPGTSFTIDSTLANTAVVTLGKLALYATKNSDGSAKLDTLYNISTTSEAERLFGARSALYWMCDVALRNTDSSIRACAVDKASTSSARVVEINFDGLTAITANQVGTHTLSIGDWSFAYTAAVGNNAVVLLNQIREAINENDMVPFTAPGTAVSNGTTMDITFTTASTEWNDLVLEDSGNLITFDDTAGVGLPEYNVSSNIGDSDDDTFVLSDNTSPTTASLKTELDRRWGENVNLSGHAIDAYKGTETEITTHLATKNSEHISTLCVPATTKAPTLLLATALAAIAAKELGKDPARSLNTLILRSVRATKGFDFNIGARDTILKAGGTTTRKQPGGEMAIERVVTTYTQNTLGVASNAFVDITTPYSLMYIKRKFNSIFTSKFGRVKLVDTEGDYTRVSVAGATTLNEIKVTAISIYDDLISEGVVENKDFFVSTLVVEKDTSDPTRVNVLMQPDLVNSLQQFNVTIRFALEA